MANEIEKIKVELQDAELTSLAWEDRADID